MFDFTREAKVHFNAGRVAEAYQCAMKADETDMWIQYILGTGLRTGKGAARNNEKAVAWFKKSAEQGCAQAMFRLAFMYRNGEGVSPDDSMFFRCLKEAAAAGLPGAQWNLALCLRDGVGCRKNEIECNRWLRAAADNGDLNAIHFIQTNAYCCVGASQRDAVSASKVFISYSSKDRAIAEEVVRYLEQNGVCCWIAPRDIPPGKEYADSIVEAIECSFSVIILFSTNSNGSIYCRKEMDLAVAKEKLILPFRIEAATPTRSMAFYLSNVQWVDAYPDPHQKFDDLLCTLRQMSSLSDNDGSVFANGSPIEIYNQGVAAAQLGHYEDARALYERAAERGLALAENNLGLLLLEGLGGKQDGARAIVLLERAVSKNLPLAYESLGRCYHDGRVVKVDVHRAFQLFRKGAELGDALSQYELARAYWNGEGVDCNQEESKFWLKQAVLQDEPNALYVYACMLELCNKQDAKLANETFQRACALGHPLAVLRKSGVETPRIKLNEWPLFDIGHAKVFADRDGRCGMCNDR